MDDKFLMFLNDVPLDMQDFVRELDKELTDKGAKKEILKASDCKKLNGGTCSSTCPGGYQFHLDGVELKKCRSMAFLHALNEESYEHIQTTCLCEVKR